METKNLKNKRYKTRTELREYIIENFNNLNEIFNFNKN